MRRNDREFINTRTRFQRLSDSEFFTGWVEDLSSPHFEVRSTLSTYEIGDTFLFELYGDKANLIFIARLEGVDAMNALQKTTPNAPKPKTARCAKVKGRAKDQVALEPETEAEDSTSLYITFEFALVSEKKYVEPKEPARKAVQSLTAVLTRGAEKTEVSISDISANGVGLLTTTSYEVGEVVGLSMTAMMRTIHLQCQVRHCHRDKQIQTMYRTGLQFENMNRVDVVAWAKVMDAA